MRGLSSRTALSRRALRQAGIAGACALAAAAAAACGSSSSSATAGSSSSPVTVTYWSSGTQAEISYIDTQFDKAHPGIKAVGQYIASADQSTAKEIAAIKSGTEPNVVIGQDPSSLPLLAQSGKVVDLTSALKPETDALYPGIRTALMYQGKQLGFALGGVGDYCLFYNKTDFKNAGITSPPTTWAEVEQDAIKLSNPAKHHYGIYIPLGSSEWISYLWEGFLWANGGQFLSSDGKSVAFDSKAGVDALTTWVNLIRKDHAAPMNSYAEAGSYDGAPAFAGDNVSMIVEGQFALQPFRDAKIDFGVAPFPTGTSGKSATGIGVGVASVFDHGDSANKAAEEFLQWLGQPAQGAYLTAQSSGLPSAPNQLTQPAVRKEAASDPTYKVFADQLKTGQSRPTIPAYAAISTALSTEIDAALRGTISPADALAKAAQQGNQAIQQSS
jgi:ABC-type glycerol-3-phosphate transport system substrate-binding protein